MNSGILCKTDIRILYYKKKTLYGRTESSMKISDSQVSHDTVIIFLVFFFEFLTLQQTDTNRFLLQLQRMPCFIVIAAGWIDEQTVFRADKIIIVYALKILKSHE